MTVATHQSLYAPLTPHSTAAPPTRCSWRHRCPCGREYEACQWAALPLFIRLTAVELASVLTSWPEQMVIEVRSCAHCDRRMSRATPIDQLAKTGAHDVRCAPPSNRRQTGGAGERPEWTRLLSAHLQKGHGP
jgi:hypothetical protein